MVSAPAILRGRMLVVSLALVASCCWGVADFAGGLKARTLPLPFVLLAIQGTGVAGVLAVIAVTGEPLPGAHAVVLSLVAGAAGTAALGCFYHALSIGTMGVVAPLSATGVALPVAVGLVTGGALSPLVSAGLALAVAGVLLASREQRDDDAAVRRAGEGRGAVALALIAALGFGTYFTLADSAADASVLWLLALARLVALPAIALFAVRAHVQRATRALRGRDLAVLAAAGALDVAATGLYGLANRHGSLAVVAVVGSLYPVMTVLLARVVLDERLRRVQAAGVLAALAGVALVAAG